MPFVSVFSDSSLFWLFTVKNQAAGAASGSREVRFLNTLTLRRGVPVTRKAVKAALELSLRRMGVERLDLVQLCW